MLSSVAAVCQQALKAIATVGKLCLKCDVCVTFETQSDNRTVQEVYLQEVYLLDSLIVALADNKGG